MRIRRVMRMNYDKTHRCPGWSGAGWLVSKTYFCEGGSIAIDYQRRWWRFRFYLHKPCGTLVLPYHARWVDWRTYKWLISQARWERKDKRLRQALERRWDEEEDW